MEMGKKFRHSIAPLDTSLRPARIKASINAIKLAKAIGIKFNIFTLLFYNLRNKLHKVFSYDNR
jgi:hypothetical protein